jgi:hypothetical protein
LRERSPRFALLARSWITLQFDYGSLGWGRNGVMTRRSFLFPLYGRRTIVGRIKTTSFFLPLALSVLPYTYCSMLDQGVWAEVKVAGEHLRLFAEHNALGVQASVYNVIGKTWIAPSEPVDDLEQGKERAAAHAQQYLKGVGNLELPPLRWKESRSA